MRAVGVKRAPAVVGLAWIGVILLAAVLTGCRRFTVLYAVFLAVSAGIAAGELLLLKAVYRDGLTRLLPALRKFTGYAIAAQYIAHAFPRVQWENAGLITDGQAVAGSLNYAPLPDGVKQYDQQQLQQLTGDGQPLS